ncbi:MAG: SpoIIE family protein phosphatase, partial [Leptospiraceae bacterium]|nr:SpoIIE family protein phosphatase [Leptospiraceae bacterium]
HTVLEATSGTEALAVLQDRGPVDLVLLDVMMPGLTGYEVCRILRESHSPAQLPIVLLTARNRTEDVIQGLASGANDYLAKPFEAEELRARVRNMIALKEAARTEANLAVIQHELSMARMIQQSLLPASIESPPGLKIAHRYRAMVNVGGDFYDYRLNEKGLSLLIADVSGHGVPAALIVSVIKMAYSFQSERSENPAELLHELNRMLRGNVGEEFVTGCALHFSPDGKSLQAANAGHPPLLIWKKAKGEILEIRPFGRVMALLEDGGYQGSGPIELESGDRILMYTDGAFEGHSPDGQQFGMERLKDFLQSGTGMDLEKWLDALLQLLIQHSGGEKTIEDDIALIAIELE